MRASQKLKKVRQTNNQTQISQMIEFDFLLSEIAAGSKQRFFC